MLVSLPKTGAYKSCHNKLSHGVLLMQLPSERPVEIFSRNTGKIGYTKTSSDSLSQVTIDRFKPVGRYNL